MNNPASQHPLPDSHLETISAEKHYRIQELGSLWGLSSQTIRRLFQNEPGVIAISAQSTKTKRRYVTLRIPESVAQRVHLRLQKPGLAMVADPLQNRVAQRKPQPSPAKPVAIESAS